MKYSALSVLRHGLAGNRRWPEAWRSVSPKPRYDVVIVGGGGHGLATAYYLARLHGCRSIAVLERGWIGGGNVGRNTTIVRSNYLLEQNNRFYEFSMKLWEDLSHELNYNVMFSQRGVLNVAHTNAQLEAFARRGNAMRIAGIDAELFDVAEIAAQVPGLDTSGDARFPILGGLFQPRGGTARHDAIAWGYARAASSLGVDIIENCEVTGFIESDRGIRGVRTTRGEIEAERVGVAVAGNSSEILRLAGLARLPVESHVLQAFVSEPLKPLLDTVVTFGAGHFYISQSDKGGLVFGGDLEGYNSYAQRGDVPIVEDVAACGMALFPNLGRLRVLRSWAGVVDMSMDGSPIICRSPVDGLFINCGWCYGGFKATPASGWCFAHTIASGEPHELNVAFSLDRFGRGAMIDEKGVGPVPHLH